MQTDMKKILFLLAAGLFGSCSAQTTAADEVLLVKTPSKVSLFLPCAGHEARYIRVDMDYFLNPAKCTRLWRLTRAYDVERTGDYTFQNRLSKEFVYPGEWECAFMQLKEGRRMPDFTGGFHGYEELSEVSLLLDGEPQDLARVGNGDGREVKFRQKSQMYEYGTDRPIAGHIKELTFSTGGIEIVQQVTWLEEVEVDNMKLAMLPIARSLNDGTQITDRLVMDDSERVYDVSRSDRTLSVEGRDVRKVCIWGRESGLFAEVEVDYEPWMPENRFFCSMYTPQDGYNKLYFDYCGNRVVSRGEVWKSEARYRLGIFEKKERR